MPEALDSIPSTTKPPTHPPTQPTNQINKNKPGMVAHAYSLSHIGEGNRRIAVLGCPQTKAQDPIWIINQRIKGRGVAQVVESLLRKHETLTSNPSTPPPRKSLRIILKQWTLSVSRGWVSVAKCPSFPSFMQRFLKVWPRLEANLTWKPVGNEHSYWPPLSARPIGLETQRQGGSLHVILLHTQVWGLSWWVDSELLPHVDSLSPVVFWMLSCPLLTFLPSLSHFFLFPPLVLRVISQVIHCTQALLSRSAFRHRNSKRKKTTIC
jgi:hypothetical protein